MSSPNTDTLAGLASSGVEALIERLRDEGVAAGKAQAEQMTTEAEQRARKIIRTAEARAEVILNAAHKQAEAERNAGEEALRIAMRDTVLRLKAELSDRFSDEVRRLIAAKMQQEEFLERLILEVAARARDEAGVEHGERTQVLLPRSLVGLEELRRNPLELNEGSLSHFVLSIAANVLADGVTFSVGDDDAAGVRLYLEDNNVYIDLTDDKVAALLLQHLQPRFRAILEGTVK